MNPQIVDTILNFLKKEVQADYDTINSYMSDKVDENEPDYDTNTYLEKMIELDLVSTYGIELKGKELEDYNKRQANSPWKAQTFVQDFYSAPEIPPA
jgi:beta-xylosidase